MLRTLPTVIRLIATTLLLHVPFLTLKQMVELCTGLFPDEFDAGKCAELLRSLLKDHVKAGLLDVRRKVLMLPTPMLAGDRPIHIWHRDDPSLDPKEFEEQFQALKAKHRGRLPKVGKYIELNLYFATSRTSELADGVTPIIDCQVVSERLDLEEKEKGDHKLAGDLHLDRFVPAEFQEYFADFFINCHFNMAWVYLKTRVSAPSEAVSWRPCIGRPKEKIDDYPHAVRSTERGETAMFFGGGLGPVVTHMIHDKLAATYVSYEDW